MILSRLPVRSSHCASHCSVAPYVRFLCITTNPTNSSSTKSDNKAGLSLFPWIPSGEPSMFPKWPSIFSILFLKYVQRGGRTFMDGADVVSANKVAFQAATEAIFTHPLMEDHKRRVASEYPNGAIANSNEANSEPPLKMSDIFAPNLAIFFERAIEAHRKNASLVCTYSLKSIKRITFTDIDWYMGTPRIPKLITVSPLRGYHIFAVPEGHEVPPPTPETLFKLALERLDVSKYLLRLSVDVECEEVFAITDAETGAIIQGDLNPSTVIHQVVLQNVLTEKDPTINTGWRIMDIDNWLDGNKYWISKEES